MFLPPTSLIFVSFFVVTVQVVTGCQCAANINTQCSNRNGTYYNGHCYYLSSKLAISFAAATQKCVSDGELFNTPGYIGRLAIFFVRDLYDLAVTNNTAIQNVQFNLGVRTAPGKDGSTRFDDFIWGGHTLTKTQSYLSWAVNNINVGLNVSGMNGIVVNHSTNWTIMSDSSMPNNSFMCELFCEGDVVPCGGCDPSPKQINMSYCRFDPNPLFQLCSNSSLFTKMKYNNLFDEYSPFQLLASESQCCPLCLSRSGCTSYAYSLGTCYFKNESGPVEINGIVNYGVCKELQTPCYKAVHADIIGNDLISKSSMMESDCYGFCNNTPGCKAYSYTKLTNNGTCYLKTSAVTATRPLYLTTSIGVLTNRNYFQPENCTSVGGIFVGGRCFISPSFSASWDYALSWCRNFAIYMSTTGRLASFIDDTEMSQVAKSFINSSSDFAWIGLRTNCSCTNNMSDFYWMGAQNTAWKAVAPGGSYSSEVDQLSYPSCIMAGNVGNKRNDNCSNHHFFICEIDCSPMPTIYPIITTSCSNTNINSNSVGCLFTTTEHPSTSTSTTRLTTSSSSSPATTTGSSSFHATSTIRLTSDSSSSPTSTVWSSFQVTSSSQAISKLVSNTQTTQVITTTEEQQDIETTTLTGKFSNEAFSTTTKREITSSLLSSSPVTTVSQIPIQDVDDESTISSTSLAQIPIQQTLTSDDYIHTTASTVTSKTNSTAVCMYGDWSEYSDCRGKCEINRTKSRKRFLKISEKLCEPTSIDSTECTIDDCNPLTKDFRLAANVLQSLGCTFLISSCTTSIVVALLLKDWSVERFIHAAEEVALMLAHVAIALARDQRNHVALCTWVSLGIQFCFTSLFVFITLEAAEVYSLLTFVTVHGLFTCRQIVFIGLGVPALGVAVTCIGAYKKVVSPFTCWLNLGDKVVTYGTFLPATVCFGISWVLLEAISQHHFEMAFFKTDSYITAKINQRSLLVLLPLQFAAWFVGQSAIYYQNFAAFSTVFALNITLGVAIVFFHVLSNAKGRHLICKLFGKCQKYEKMND